MKTSDSVGIIPIDHSLPGKCEICGGSDREDLILLCDGQGCDLEFHTFCLQPPLQTIPEGSWLCPLCDSNGATLTLTTILENGIVSGHLDEVASSLTGKNDYHSKLSLGDEFEVRVGFLVKLFCDKRAPPLSGRILKSRFVRSEHRLPPPTTDFLIRFKRCPSSIC